MDARDAAHAVELVRALRDQLHEMTRQLAWIERQDVTGTTSRPLAICGLKFQVSNDISRPP